MPRIRVLSLAFAATLLSLGLGAGLAWRWLAREMLARRAGRQASLRELVGAPGETPRGLWTGLRLLPVTWGGLLLASPLLPSAWPDLAPHGLFYGWALVVALPILGAALLLGLLAHAYRGAPFLLEAFADTEPTPGAFRRPLARHVLVAAALSAPAIVVGTLLVFSWPGLFAIRLSLLAAALAPAGGALAALPALLSSTKAAWREPPPRARRTRRAVPRWAVPAGLVTLAFSWGVVAARVHNLASNDTPLLSPATLARLEPGLRRAEQTLHTYATVVGSGRLVSAHLECETDVVQWAPVGRRAIGWCEDWIEQPDGGDYGNVFFLLGDADFGEGRLPPVGHRIFLGLVEAVAPLPGGALVVHRPIGSKVREAVVLSVRGDQIEIAGQRVLPQGRADAVVWPLGREVAVSLPGVRDLDDRWILFDARLEPQRVSAVDRLRDEIGIGWLLLLAIAAVATAGAVRAVVRAGRLGRVLEARRTGLARMPLDADGPGIFVGRLESAGDVGLLRTNEGRSLAIDPAGATWIGWPEGALRGGPCVVLGERCAPGGGAYRAGLAEVRGGRPFAIFEGDLRTAAAHAEALREHALRRSLPLLWAVSLVPFAAVIASS